MAGRTRARRSVYPHPPGKALVASSAYYTGAQAPKVYGTDQGWQAECYRFYTIIGEARYAAQFYGNSLSKCELYMANPVPQKDGPPRWEASYDSTEALFLDDLFSGKVNQAEMLHKVGVHKTVSGECFVIGYHPDGVDPATSTAGDGKMLWGVYSPLEVGTNGKNWTLKFEGLPDKILEETDVVIRIWWPDPYRRGHADSPFKSLLSVLHEIEDLTLHIQAQTISRLAGAGIMWVPESMDLPDETDEDGNPVTTANGPSKLMKLIAEAGATALKDRGHPSSRVPIIIQVPDELLDKMANLLTTFWSPLDEKAIEMRAAALHRFASGMDMPNEQTEGMSSNGGTGGGRSNGVSHWGAWQIEESAIKIHYEPAMETIAAAITVSYIRIQVPGTKMQVKFSTEKLRLRPDRSKEALELYDRGVLNKNALIRENGFETADVMDDEEFSRWLLVVIAKGSTTPDQVAAAAHQLGVINLPGGPPGTNQEARPTPSLENHPTRPRDPEERLASALVPVCHSMVLSALARVGNRLMNLKAGKVTPPAGVPTYATHTFAVGDLDADRLLADAFPMANEMLDGIADPADVMPTLQRYTATLVAGRTAHSREEMARWLAEIEVGP